MSWGKRGIKPEDRKGIRVRIVNTIPIYYRKDSNIHIFTIAEPGTSKFLMRFADDSKESAFANAVIWCKNNSNYSKRSLQGSRKGHIGHAINVCLTHEDLVYLLSIIPQMERNRKLISKVEDGVRHSIRAKQEYASKNK